jgi:hypothetical protein
VNRLVALLELPSGSLTLAESLGAPETFTVALPPGSYRVLLDAWSGTVQIESAAHGNLVTAERVGSLAIEGYSLLVGDHEAIERAADRDGERFWSELFAKIANSVDGVAAGSFDLVSGATVAFTGMAAGVHELHLLRDPSGLPAGISVAG